ncbi:MAG: hypothetical protein PGN13_09480 [Patulibacter minatonensis]
MRSSSSVTAVAGVGSATVSIVARARSALPARRSTATSYGETVGTGSYPGCTRSPAPGIACSKVIFPFTTPRNPSQAVIPDGSTAAPLLKTQCAAVSTRFVAISEPVQVFEPRTR